MLSLRAEGHPKEAKPGAEDVSSQMTGSFLMGDGKLTLQALVYTLPGATVQLQVSTPWMERNSTSPAR